MNSHVLTEDGRMFEMTDDIIFDKLSKDFRFQTAVKKNKVTIVSRDARLSALVLKIRTGKITIKDFTDGVKKYGLD